MNEALYYYQVYTTDKKVIGMVVAHTKYHAKALAIPKFGNDIFVKKLK
jgi:hypothetical protein